MEIPIEIAFLTEERTNAETYLDVRGTALKPEWFIRRKQGED
jgi:hypothetical protein